MLWRGERRVSGGIGETILRLEPLDVLAIQELDRDVGMRFEQSADLAVLLRHQGLTQGGQLDIGAEVAQVEIRRERLDGGRS